VIKRIRTKNLAENRNSVNRVRTTANRLSCGFPSYDAVGTNFGCKDK
jgi:hypothetical protein